METRTAGVTDRLLTTTEVADLLGMSRAWVVKQIRRGALQGHRMGSRYMVRSEAVEEFLQYTAVKQPGLDYSDWVMPSRRR